MANEITKTCTMCGVEQDVDNFTGYKRTLADGSQGQYYMSRCRPCTASARRDQYHNDPDKREMMSKSSDKWRRSNLKHCAKASTDYYHRVVKHRKSES